MFSSEKKEEKIEYSTCRERGTKKKSESRRESNPWPSVHRSGALTTELLGDSWRAQVIFTEFVVTRVLHTARISNVEGTVCDDKERKMVNFKLGKKWERWDIQFVTSVGQRKNVSSRRESNQKLLYYSRDNCAIYVFEEGHGETRQQTATSSVSTSLSPNKIVLPFNC